MPAVSLMDEASTFKNVVLSFLARPTVPLISARTDWSMVIVTVAEREVV